VYTLRMINHSVLCTYTNLWGIIKKYWDWIFENCVFLYLQEWKFISLADKLLQYVSLFPLFLPVLGTFLKFIFWNCQWLCHCTVYWVVLTWHKFGFQGWYWVMEQEKVIYKSLFSLAVLVVAKTAIQPVLSGD